MRFAVAAVAAGVVGIAAAQNATASDVWVTDVVTAFTTFCPEATLLTHKGQTYTVNSATTLTITNCPGGCTISKPISTTSISSSSSPAAPVSASSTSAVVTPTPYTSLTTSVTSAPVVPPPYTSASSSPAAPVSAAPYPSVNGTAVAPVGTASSSGSAATSSSTLAPYTGSASTYSAAGAGFLALLGMVAAL